jgi:isoleucyl-tRNA synthetase
MVDDSPKNNDKDERGKPGVAKTETALREEEVLRFWQQDGIFEKSLAKDAPNGEFVFYDGPPFATGLPHYGSLLSSIIKDVIPRYKTMRGFRVRRVWGWDCHGLPIENMIEKELGLKSKKDILEMGIDVFNEACRAAVLRYADEWEKYIDRVGRWVEFKGAYKTMDNSYIESTWWGLKQIYEKGLLYEGRKVLLYCPHCETPLSKAEIAMDNSYKDVTEESVTVKFKVKNPEKHGLPDNTFLLAWTTTPWTLPGNVALAVGNDIEYVVFEKEGEQLVVAKGLYKNDGKIVTELKGKDLVGLSYEPLFDIPKVREQRKKNAFTVLSADFVTTEEGTGVVHTAVIYGEDDYALGLKEDLPMVPLLDASGSFNNDAPELIRGQYFKKAEKAIKEDLENRGLLFAREAYTHSYPHCHRCGTALIYNALVSWFINIQKIKARMLETNEDINWVPEHLKHGRYKNIVENAPDWTISRNRFWASPMPIWKNPKTNALTVIGSHDELKKRTKCSGNQYFLMRHGESESNRDAVTSSRLEAQDSLTEKGIAEVTAVLDSLKDKHIDLLITSPYQRTKQTTEIVQKALGLGTDAVVEDARLGEIKMGVLDGKDIKTYREFLCRDDWWPDRAPDGGESWNAVKQRAGELLYELERTYSGKKILFIGHNSPLNMLSVAAKGKSLLGVFDRDDDGKRFANAEIRALEFVPLPHNRHYELDFHRPYIDEVTLVDEDGTELVRTPEVIDGWVESGSMPFAERHYPFAKNDTFEPKEGKEYPADFIAEYIAQTRTWFYYMHAISVLLFDKPSFKSVVTTGTILAADGTKMSKSKGNYTDPLITMDKFGADALRYYMMASVIMQAEDLSFKDEELREAHNRVVNLLWNTYTFYGLYKPSELPQESPFESPSVLDQWILERLNWLIWQVTEDFDVYNMPDATRPIRKFIEDLSTWYIRRSRDRFKSDNRDDRAYALATTRYILLTFSKLIAPVMPFIAESIYKGVGGEKESVHLETWPEAGTIDAKMDLDMQRVREVVSLALEARSRAGIKVRQPLQKLSVRDDVEEIFKNNALLALIKDEINVKEVAHDATQSELVILDTTITESLKQEGMARELIRGIQELRKTEELVPSDRIALTVEAPKEGEVMIEAHRAEIMRATGADALTLGETNDMVTISENIAISIEKK